mgnify:CR=1 FL=1|jgi:inner membrane protein
MFDLAAWMNDNQDWIWLAIGVALLIGEVLIPGVFLLWIGLAGLATGLIVAVASDLSFEIQGMLFAILSIVSVIIGRNIMKNTPEESAEAPNLNKKGATMVGKNYVLASDIMNGEGRVKVGDTVWIATGQDMPKGTRVTVDKVDGTKLHVVRCSD